MPVSTHPARTRWTPRRYFRPQRSGYQTKKIASQVNKAIVAQAEKRMNLYELNVSFSSRQNLTELTGIPPLGTTAAARVGNKIAITELSFQGVSSEGSPTLPWMTTGTGSGLSSVSGRTFQHRIQHSHSAEPQLLPEQSTDRPSDSQPTLLYKFHDLHSHQPWP